MNSVNAVIPESVCILQGNFEISQKATLLNFK